MSQLPMDEQAIKDLRIIGGEGLVRFVLEASQTEGEKTEEVLGRVDTTQVARVVCRYCGNKYGEGILTCQGCGSQSLGSDQNCDDVGKIMCPDPDRYGCFIEIDASAGRTNIVHPGISAREFERVIRDAFVPGSMGGQR